MTDTTAPRTAAPPCKRHVWGYSDHGVDTPLPSVGGYCIVCGKLRKRRPPRRKVTAADHLVYPGGPPCQPNCPGEWSMYHDGYADGYERAEAEAIEPLLALVRAAQKAFVAAEFPHGTDMSTWSKAEVERFWVDADTRWMEARKTFLGLYAALPESVRVAARKPE